MHIIHDCMICLMLNHFITISHFNVFLFKHIAFSYPNDTEEQKGGTVSVLYRHRHFSTHKRFCLLPVISIEKANYASMSRV